MQRAKAFVFAAEEDFGIVPVEAQAAGTPVIAYRKGGSLETVVENKTGVFFDSQSVEAIINAVEYFEKISSNFNNIRENAEQFSVKNFSDSIKSYIDSKIK